MRRSLSLLLLLLCGVASADEAPQASDYFTDLTRLGVIDVKTGTAETLDQELALGEAALERGDPGRAAAVLLGIVDSPRFADFSDTVAYQNAEYDLIVALGAGGAHEDALRIAERALARGPRAHYFAVAHRRAVDIAITSRAYLTVLARLEAIKLTEPLPVEAASERSYLRGRAAYDKAELDAAERELTAVSRKSRLFSSAMYLRGVLRVRQGKLADAQEAFCEIAGNSDEKLRFVVDDRFFALKDLARLGAARVAHEEHRYDDAYYHYFQIPDDSDRLPEALFEAAWSMYQKRELRTARQLTDELLKSFPSAPQVPEAMLLAGYIELADCKFTEARQKFDALGKDLRPLVAAVEKARATREARRALLGRALARAQRRGPSAPPLPALGATPDDRVIAMLRLDPKLLRLDDTLAGLRHEATLAPGVAAAWRELEEHLPGTHVAQVPSEQAVLRERVKRLALEVKRERSALLEKPTADASARLPELDRAAAKLEEIEEGLVGTPTVGGDPGLRARIAADVARTGALADRAATLAEGFDRTADQLAAQELLRLHHQLVRIFEKARLGTIDAVIGEKRMYEKEIELIAADKYAPRQVGKVYEHGLIGEDEEYWPPEEEVWEDEFEGWK